MTINDNTDGSTVIPIVAFAFDPTLYPPFVEDFEEGYPAENWGEMQGLLRSGTITFSNTTSSDWTADGFGNIGSVGSAKMNIYSTTKDEWMVTPPIDLGTAGVITSYSIHYTKLYDFIFQIRSY